MQTLHSGVRPLQARMGPSPRHGTTGLPQPLHTARRPVAAAAAAEDGYEGGGYPQQQQQREWQDRGQRGGRGGGRGGGGRGGGGRGGYGYRNNNQQRYNNNNNGGPRGEVSYDEGDYGEQQGGSGGRGRGGYGGRGGGYGRGGRGGGQKQRRFLSPEAQAVNEAITNAGSWRQLSTLLEQQSRPGMPGLDSFQLVEVMMRLTRIDKPQQGDDVADYQEFVAKLYGWVLDRLPTFRPRQFANTVFAMGKLNLYNQELMSALLQAMLPELPRFNAMEYVRLLDGFVRLNMAPPQEVADALFTPEAAGVIVGTSSRNELGVILNLCQRLGLAPTPEWLAIMADAALAQLAASRDQVLATDVVKLVVGLAGMGWRPSQEQWQGLVEVTLAQLPTGYLRARNLVELAWAFSQYGSAMPQQWAQAFNYQMYRQAQYMSPADVGSVLYSLAYIKAPPSAQQLQRVLGELRRRVDAATGDDLANVVMALVQFNYKPVDVLFDDMLIELQQRLSTCSAGGLNNIITSLPALGNGIRLQQVVSEAVSRYDALMAQQPYGEGDAVAAAPLEQPAAPAAAAEEAYAAAGEAQPVA